MLRHLQISLTVLALLLGLAHVVYGIAAFKTISAQMVWFIGAGIAMIIAAIANFARNRSALLQVQNTIITLYIIGIVGIAPTLPQAWAALILFGGLLVLSVTGVRLGKQD